jgi:hypothetical protein
MTTAWQLVITAEAEVIPGPAPDDENEPTEAEEVPE